MSMPALQLFSKSLPSVQITMLVKPAVAALWNLHNDVYRVFTLERGPAGVFRAARFIRSQEFDRAYILPHSFRSALVPLLGRVKKRIGLPGHRRDFMLTDVLSPIGGPGRNHQCFEYIDLLCPEFPIHQPPKPTLMVPTGVLGEVETWLPSDGSPWIGILPGAARGPAKQWPQEHFIELGARLVHKGVGRIAIMGSVQERELCARITAGIKNNVVNLAGKTPFAVWAGVLQRCSAVVANDSGGMHLSAALGTPVVGLFGWTDPEKTGPLGPSRILQHSRIRDRDIARNSVDARMSLASIQPVEVYDAVLELLEQTLSQHEE